MCVCVGGVGVRGGITYKGGVFQQEFSLVAAAVELHDVSVPVPEDDLLIWSDRIRTRSLISASSTIFYHPFVFSISGAQPLFNFS